MATSRTRHAKQNVIWAIINKLVVLLTGFLSRTVFIYCLGVLYLGLNSLFTSLLSFLSLAELGVGSAMVFSMYKPMAKGDDDTVCALLSIYRKFYRIIGLFILIAGLCVSPFLKYFIKGEVPSEINIYILYLLFLFNTVISYLLFAYKRSILTASQHSDLINKISSTLSICSSICTIAVIYFFHNYYLYCIILIIVTISNNLVINYVVNKQYPQYKCRGTISKEQLTDIKKRVAGLFVYRICYISRDALDAVCISAFIGLSVLGKYHNYMFIINTIAGTLLLIRNSITASIGNSLVTESEEKNHQDFKKCQLLYMWVSVWCVTCIYCLAQPFIKIWIGAEYLLGQLEISMFCLYFICRQLGDICATYRHASGIWWQDKHRPIVEAFVKTLLNLIIIRYYGVAGALGVSVFCLFFINSIWASRVLYKYYFKNHKQYYYVLRNLFYLVAAVVISVIVSAICNMLPESGLSSFIGKCVICLFIPNILIIPLFSRLPEYKSSIVSFKKVLHA